MYRNRTFPGPRDTVKGQGDMQRRIMSYPLLPPSPPTPRITHAAVHPIQDGAPVQLLIKGTTTDHNRCVRTCFGYYPKHGSSGHIRPSAAYILPSSPPSFGWSGKMTDMATAKSLDATVSFARFLTFSIPSIQSVPRLLNRDARSGTAVSHDAN